jgi:hypothetical protein
LATLACFVVLDNERNPSWLSTTIVESKKQNKKIGEIENEKKH